VGRRLVLLSRRFCELNLEVNREFDPLKSVLFLKGGWGFFEEQFMAFSRVSRGNFPPFSRVLSCTFLKKNNNKKKSLTFELTFGAQHNFPVNNRGKNGRLFKDISTKSRLISGFFKGFSRKMLIFVFLDVSKYLGV